MKQTLSLTHLVPFLMGTVCGDVIRGCVKIRGQPHHPCDGDITKREGRRPGNHSPGAERGGGTRLTWTVPSLTKQCGRGGVGSGGVGVCTQSCLILCNPMDCSPPGSSVHAILQARIPEWVAIHFSRGSSRPRD